MLMLETLSALDVCRGGQSLRATLGAGATLKQAPLWRVLPEPIYGPVERLRELAGIVSDELLRAGLYTEDEMDALDLSAIDGEREVSWAAPAESMAGPLTIVAVSDEDAVVAGVEMWQQQRDRFWFLEVLVRDQAPVYKGAGAAVANAAIAWLVGHSDYGIRVHAMARETRAVAFWSRLLGRAPDFSDAFQRSRGFYFPAVGWVIRAGASV